MRENASAIRKVPPAVDGLMKTLDQQGLVMEKQEESETTALTRRLAARAAITVCEAGHPVAWEAPELAYEVPCPHCRRWTWEDGSFCVWCGGKLRAQQ